MEPRALDYTHFAERSMTTAVRAVSIQTFVEDLRRVPASTYSPTETCGEIPLHFNTPHGKSVEH